MNYYNEFDPFAAAWLRELISQRLIPRGLVDERSITEVKAEDLEGFTQCHFFAGIGGWPLALQLAGISHRTPLWTGSPPCQPFSVAGKQLGQLDDRHLAPTFMRLVAQCRPPVLFGEQVAAAIGKHWLDDLFTEMERQGYACGSAVLPAASVGAPHKRDRLFFGAHQLVNSSGERIRMRTRESVSETGKTEKREEKRQRVWPDSGAERCNLSDWVAGTNGARPQRREGVPECGIKLTARSCGMADELANALCEQCDRGGNIGKGRRAQHTYGSFADSTNPDNTYWSGADWLGCRDGKFRPVEPGTFPLADGVSARVGRLRGYGNAIVPQAAAEFIRAFMGAAGDAAKG